MLPECRKWRTPSCPGRACAPAGCSRPRKVHVCFRPADRRWLCKCVEPSERAKNLAKSRTRCPKFQNIRARDSRPHPLPAPCQFRGTYGCPGRRRPVANRLGLSRRTVEKFRPRPHSAAQATGKASVRPESRTRTKPGAAFFLMPPRPCRPCRRALVARRDLPIVPRENLGRTTKELRR